MAVDCAINTEKYSLLDQINVDIQVSSHESESFSLCFWVYLLDSTTYPSTIVRQVHSGISVSAPLLVLDENKKMILLPLTLLHKEAPDPLITSSWREVPNVSTKSEFPLKQWVHVGCEVSRKHIRLHINGEIVGELAVTPLMENGLNSDIAGKISLFSVGGNGYSVQGFIHSVEVLSTSVPVKSHYTMDPPLWLSVDKPSTSGIEVDEDGVWSVVGGEASSREMFSLDVVLLNAIGQPVNKDVKVLASLLYADSMTPVEKMSDSEAPLLIISEGGDEFSAEDKPCDLLNGRASFKLKISQLTSKSDKRLFCIKFKIQNKPSYPFFEAVTCQIRCISKRFDSVTPKRSNHIEHCVDEVGPKVASSNGSLPTKRIRLGEERISESNKLKEGNGVSMEWRPQSRVEEEDNSSTDSENNEARDSPDLRRRYTISDSMIFRYCLGNLTERSLLLKEITNNSSDQEVSKFSDQVSLFSGCSHHSYQIKMARKLIAEGTNAWILISRNYQHVHWDNVVVEIEEHFMRISKCSSRSLTRHDSELLRRISGCYEYITQENFERMWCWLFPVATAISRGLINGMWRSSSSPRWIEGFVTKEEAEYSLQRQEPGTFVLRFPTSRSWPHSDAGSLVVTYVGRDFVIRHRLLAIDHICDSSERYTDAKPLQDMILAEPELSRLGRIIRSI